LIDASESASGQFKSELLAINDISLHELARRDRNCMRGHYYSLDPVSVEKISEVIAKAAGFVHCVNLSAWPKMPERPKQYFFAWRHHEGL
jgi:hypothetical protein